MKRKATMIRITLRRRGVHLPVNESGFDIFFSP
jgi:hypothetical protein